MSSCESYEQQQQKKNVVEESKLQYKQPIDYSKIQDSLKDNVKEISSHNDQDRDEEIVVVNLEDYNNAPKSTSIVDIVMKGDDKNE